MLNIDETQRIWIHYKRGKIQIIDTEIVKNLVMIKTLSQEIFWGYSKEKHQKLEMNLSMSNRKPEASSGKCCVIEDTEKWLAT